MYIYEYKFITWYLDKDKALSENFSSIFIGVYRNLF